MKMWISFFSKISTYLTRVGAETLSGTWQLQVTLLITGIQLYL